MRPWLILPLALAAFGQDIVTGVRGAIANRNFAAAETMVRNYKAVHGATPEMIEAQSWLGRGALAAKQYDRADAYAAEAAKLALDQLRYRKLDAEPVLPLALGASIEVQAQAMAARGERAEALAFLRRQLALFAGTSLRARIQKNIHLLSLEGKPAPALDERRWLGPKPPSLAQLRGKAVILFFWAHWCPDCKKEGPLLARLLSEYGSRGLVLIGPTQHYGYVAGGVEAAPEQETAYMDAVRKQFYSELASMPAPVSEENFAAYGSSTSPTLVFIDRNGIVRLFHPGGMTYPELVGAVHAILGA